MGSGPLTSPASTLGVDTRAHCRVAARRGGGVELTRTAAGPFHAVHHRMDCGPDVLLLCRDTAGLASGDTCLTTVEVGPDASVVVSDAGPSHLLPARGDRAGEQETRLQVGPGARLVFLPHAVVPLAHSRSRLATRLRVCASGCAIAGGVLSRGRTAYGESWGPARLEQVMDVHVGTELIALDATRIAQPNAGPPGHLVNLFAYQSGVGSLLDCVRAAAGPGAGVSAVTDDLLVVKAIVPSYRAGYALLGAVSTTLQPELVHWDWSRIGYGL